MEIHIQTWQEGSGSYGEVEMERLGFTKAKCFLTSGAPVEDIYINGQQVSIGQEVDLTGDTVTLKYQIRNTPSWSPKTGKFILY